MTLGQQVCIFVLALFAFCAVAAARKGSGAADLFVEPVLASQGDDGSSLGSRFTDNGNGTITDEVTGLVWEKKSWDRGEHDFDNDYGYAQLSGLMNSFNQDAFGGFSDWRVPTIEELMTIVDPQRQSLFTVFQEPCEEGCSVTSCSCWSFGNLWSSSDAGNGQNWTLVGGDAVAVPRGGGSSNYIRAVRGTSSPIATPTPSSASEPTATPDPDRCVGDCDGDGEVQVHEIAALVHLNLKGLAADVCTAGDANGNERITVDEVLIAVTNALCGCGQACPTAKPTATATATPPVQSASPTRTPTVESPLIGRPIGVDDRTGLTQVLTLALADLDSDSFLDIVVGTRRRLVILLGDGTGGVQQDQTILNVFTLSNIATEDLNDDGIVDLVVGSSLGPEVTVLLGNGDLTFDRDDYMVGFMPFGVAVGRIDDNASVDIAVSNKGSATVSTVLGSGDGTFRKDADYEAFPSPEAIAVVDIDGSGTDDVLVCQEGGANVVLFLSDEQGRLSRSGQYSATRPSDIEVADVNSDGQVDFFVTHGISGPEDELLLYLGNGNGTFRPRGAVLAFGTMGKIAAGDLNRDGFADVVATDIRLNRVVFSLGRDDGSFQDPEYLFAGAPIDVQIGDLNADGNLDIVTADVQGPGVTVFLGNGNGTFR